jgi:outer membrane protein OmpA-like peptidoglycan-associated protein
MKATFVSAALFASFLSACSSTPDSIPELEAARTLLPQVEASPRSGVAATNIAEARKALDRANKLAEDGANAADISSAALVAMRNAEIANEKITTANAKDEIEKGTQERQQILLQAREREAAAEREKARRMEQELSELQAKQTDRGMLLTLGDVLFDTGKATLKPGAYETIDRLAEVLKEDPNRRVVIEGHTDSVGSEEMNMALSSERARAVQSALTQRGVAMSQISTEGRGESVPVASNETAAGRQQNRRVEMLFTQQPKRVAAGSAGSTLPNQ